MKLYPSSVYTAPRVHHLARDYSTPEITVHVIDNITTVEPNQTAPNITVTQTITVDPSSVLEVHVPKTITDIIRPSQEVQMEQQPSTSRGPQPLQQYWPRGTQYHNYYSRNQDINQYHLENDNVALQSSRKWHDDHSHYRNNNQHQLDNYHASLEQKPGFSSDAYGIEFGIEFGIEEFGSYHGYCGWFYVGGFSVPSTSQGLNRIKWAGLPFWGDMWSLYPVCYATAGGRIGIDVSLALHPRW
ncbi:hypothetical protein BDZ45DRAFT_738808 [Acephala macrosclerotiorum]|nr:hypothetical protein BDZ45DRAFT_738808 [Acephala macrosclerotiorum]